MVAQVVTSENLKDFNAAKLGLSREPVNSEDGKAVKTVTPQAGEKIRGDAATSGGKAPVASDAADHAAESATEPEEKKNGLNERLSKLTRERNEARQALENARREAEEARQALDASRRASEGTKAKAKPAAGDFKDAFEYAEALADWKLEEKWSQKQEAERKELQRLQAERVQRTWTANVRKTAAEIADYNTVIADCNIPLTNELRDAILESELGPRIQYYLAKNPDEVERLTSMTVRGMERAFGKLEMMIEEEMAKHQHKSDDPLPDVKLPRKKPEAPEPITPINATGVGAATGVVDVNGNVVGSYKDYKAARKAGKIR
jgi:hypothetical protein